MALFTASFQKIIGISFAFLVTSTAYAQGTKGFSSQTQGSEVRFTDRVTIANLYETISKETSPARRKEFEAAYLRLNVLKAEQELARINKKKAGFLKRKKVLTDKQHDAATNLQNAQAALAEAEKKGADKAPNIPATLDAPAIVEQAKPSAEIASGEVAIDDATSLLALYDGLAINSESRKGLGEWHVGIVSDGDFNKSVSDGNAPAPKTGSLGIDAVRMKPVYYTYTYYAKGVKDLVGRTMVMQPSFVFNTLAILFAQSTPLSTGLVSGSVQTTTAGKAFGQTLLVPGSNAQGGLSFTVNASYFPLVLFGPRLSRIAIDGSLNLTQSRWESRSVTSDVNIFAPMAGLSYKILDEHIQVGTANNNIQVLVFGRYTGRHLFGDIERHTNILTDAIGTTDRTYHGFDVGFTTSVNAIRLTVNIPIFGGNIEGFSSGQPVLGLGLAAAIKLN